MDRKDFNSFIKEAKTIVVKIGSARVSGNTNEIHDFLFSLISDVRTLRDNGKKIILVSSGAIAQGRNKISEMHDISKEKYESLQEKQALAAMGQNRLMNLYESFFSKANITIAQILFGIGDIQKKEGLKNLKSTFEQLLKWNVLPIVNENDSIATEELKLGDNDFLSAIVSALIGADLLVVLTGVDGFIKNNETVGLLKNVSQEDLRFAKGPEGPGSGGMNTKLRAAAFLSEYGIPTAIINGKMKNSLFHFVDKNESGTFISSSHLKKEFNEINFSEILKSNFHGVLNG
ncbi:MAG: glutamate 5-kinase [Leptospiraceae bacterium]|nr:glutamate 5-kinase [Leptospiraceae bacterium]MCK6379751.1 glutamate 5-kinase [Leptospiraceae bacterium]NUM40417.1 glutamate 5-kinase [Leptospiraceae bacterium]